MSNCPIVYVQFADEQLSNVLGKYLLMHEG
jgi:hypothetical protein